MKSRTETQIYFLKKSNEITKQIFNIKKMMLGIN